MPNAYYSPTGNPTTFGELASSQLRQEFSALETAFDRVAALSGNANAVVVINSSATGQAIVTRADLIKSLFFGSLAVDSKASPAESDEVLIADSAESWAIKRAPKSAFTGSGGVLSLPVASTIVRGIAEIATNGEADTGTDDARIMTPAKVKRRIDAIEGRQTVPLPALVWSRGGSLTTGLSVDSGDSDEPYVPYWSFSNSSTESIDCCVPMPKSWDRSVSFKARVLWYTEAATGGVVRWSIRCCNVSDGDTIGVAGSSRTYGTAVNIDDTIAAASGNKLQRTALSGGFSDSTPAEGDLLFFRLSRPNVASDTLAAAVHFVGMELIFETDALNDD